MSMTHRCFLRLAKDSLEFNGELWTRNSISRSYYGVYHSAQRITNNQIPTHDANGDKIAGGVHMRFSSAFCSGDAALINDVDVEQVKRIGVKLKMLHSQRVFADYKLERKINRITAISALQDAEKISDLIDSLLGESGDSLTA